MGVVGGQAGGRRLGVGVGVGSLKPGVGLLLIACLLELDWLIQLVEYKFFFHSFYIRLLLRYTVGS